MKATKHTPGPWVTDYTGNIWGDADNEKHDGDIPLIGKMNNPNDAICAAVSPELLETLKLAKWMLERDYIDPQKLEIIKKCDAVISKVTGEKAS